MSAKTKKVGKKSRQAVIFDVAGNQCVWSQAGVIKPTACVNAYDCLNCPLDKVLKTDIAQGRLKGGRVLAGWRVSSDIPSRPVDQKKCRHMLSGLVSYKNCVNDYDCANCAYHQTIVDEGLTDPPTRVEETIVSGFSLSRHYYYHRGHSWARVEYGGRVRVGLDDFATRLFGPFDRFSLPKLGSTVGQGQPGFGLTREELTAECLSPIEGVVVAVNAKAAGPGRPPVQDPYGQGWLMVIEPIRLRLGLRNLLFEEESQAWLEDEAARLTSMIAQETGYRLAATGGRALPDIYGQVPDIGWEHLTREFLLT
ncbi:MAG: hypothetical protein AB1896_15730 [Thermodesulfobacteriota bacterium]